MADWFSGYAIDAEQRGMLLHTAATFSYMYSDDDLPDEIDPRFDSKMAEGWLRIEDQKMGCCQGCGITECAEYCYAVHTGIVKQFCYVTAYVISQKYDGITGDRGSTLSGGSKTCSEFGFLEREFGLSESGYPRGGYKAVTSEMERLAQNVKLRSYVDISDYRKAKTFIGSAVGICQTGTNWTQGLANPSSSGVIKSIGGRNMGGHSWTVAGYRKIDNLDAAVRRDMPRTSEDWAFVCKNSHSERWGDKGWAYLTAEHYKELGQNRNTVLLGRSDMDTPAPRPSKIDFTKPEDRLIA